MIEAKITSITKAKNSKSGRYVLEFNCNECGRLVRILVTPQQLMALQQTNDPEAVLVGWPTIEKTKLAYGLCKNCIEKKLAATLSNIN